MVASRGPRSGTFIGNWIMTGPRTVLLPEQGETRLLNLCGALNDHFYPQIRVKNVIFCGAMLSMVEEE